MTLAELAEVWTPLTLGLNLIAGLVTGYVAVGAYAINPQYSTLVATPREIGTILFSITSAIGLVFYGLNIASSFLGGDPEWTRVVSRLGVWILYAGAISIGTSIRLRRFLNARKARILAQAQAERDRDPSEFLG